MIALLGQHTARAHEPATSRLHSPSRGNGSCIGLTEAVPSWNRPAPRSFFRHWCSVFVKVSGGRPSPDLLGGMSACAYVNGSPLSLRSCIRAVPLERLAETPSHPGRTCRGLQPGRWSSLPALYRPHKSLWEVEGWGCVREEEALQKAFPPPSPTFIINSIYLMASSQLWIRRLFS